MSAARVILGILGGGMKVAGAIGTVGTVATVGEVVAKRVGWMSPEKNLIGEAVGVALDLAGAPDAGKKKVIAKIGAVAAAAPSTAPQLPPAGESDAHRDVCPQCHADKPISFGDASGAEIRLVQCPEHQELDLGLADYWTRMSNGYIASLGQSAVDVGAACEKPKVANFFSRAKGGLDLVAYQAALIQYNSCVQQAAADKASAAAATDAAVAKVEATEAAKRKKLASQKEKIAKMLLEKQAKAYDKKIEELKAQQATEASAAKQAEVQKQIDALTAAKAESDRTADALREQAKDAQHKAEMEALAAKVADAGTKPGGLDQLMQLMVVMQQMQRPQEPATAPQQQFAPQPVMVAPDGTLLASPVAYAQPQAQYAQPQMMPAPPWSPVSEEVTFDDGSGFGYEFAGGPDAPLDSDVASAIGIEGATNEDASIYFGLLNGGNEDVLDALMLNDAPTPSVGGCNAFSCSTKG